MDGSVKGRQNCKAVHNTSCGIRWTRGGSRLCHLSAVYVGDSPHLSEQHFPHLLKKHGVPSLTRLRERWKETMGTKVLAQSVAFQKWPLSFIQQLFIEYLLWTEQQVLKIKQSKVPWGLDLIAVGRSISGRASSGCTQCSCPTILL